MPEKQDKSMEATSLSLFIQNESLTCSEIQPRKESGSWLQDQQPQPTTPLNSTWDTLTLSSHSLVNTDSSTVSSSPLGLKCHEALCVRIASVWFTVYKTICVNKGTLF